MERKKTKTGWETWTPPLASPCIIAFDPSFTAWGYAVVEVVNGEFKIVETGCIKTESETKKRKIRKGDDRVRRIKELNNTLLSLIQKYNTALIVTEQPHGSQNASAAVMIGAVIGIIQTFSDCLGIPVEWYSEGDCKHHLMNKRAATKAEVQQCIDKQYTIRWTGTGYKDEAIADAMTVFHFAKRDSATVQALSKMKS